MGPCCSTVAPTYACPAAKRHSRLLEQQLDGKSSWAHCRELDKHNVPELLLSMVRDSHRRDTVLNLHPLVILRACVCEVRCKVCA